MKTIEKYEIGKRVAEMSEGRIVLAIENGMAVLSGEFRKNDRAPIRYKVGGWRYHEENGSEFWTLNVKRIESKLEPENEPKPEPEPSDGAIEVGTIYYRWHSYGAEFFIVTRSTDKSVWLRSIVTRMNNKDKHYGRYGTATPVRQPRGPEFRKAIGENPKYLSDGIIEWDGKPQPYDYSLMD